MMVQIMFNIKKRHTHFETIFISEANLIKIVGKLPTILIKFFQLALKKL